MKDYTKEIEKKEEELKMTKATIAIIRHMENEIKWKLVTEYDEYGKPVKDESGNDKEVEPTMIDDNEWNDFPARQIILYKEMIAYLEKKLR